MGSHESDHQQQGGGSPPAAATQQREEAGALLREPSDLQPLLSQRSSLSVVSPRDAEAAGGAIVPVAAGRDLTNVVEVAALNQRMKQMGRDAARELDEKLKVALARKD